MFHYIFKILILRSKDGQENLVFLQRMWILLQSIHMTPNHVQQQFQGNPAISSDFFQALDIHVVHIHTFMQQNTHIIFKKKSKEFF